MSKLKNAFSLCLFLLIVSLASAFAEAQRAKPNPGHTGPVFHNINDLTQLFKFTPYFSHLPRHHAKIAIFDNGFAGYQSALGQNLPKDTVYEKLPLPADNSDDHGRYVAEIVQAMMTNDGQAPQFTPELHLYNVSSYTNFKAAITDAINEHIDIILYPMVKEYGSNFDGRGVWNVQVNRATRAGIIWVNSAGNYGMNTFNSPIITMSDGWVHLPDKNNSLGFRCNNPTCHIEVTLTWNDFKDADNVGTNKDLDLAIFDDLFNLVQRSELHQVMDPKLVQPGNGNSLLPRESITADIPQGQYYIQVKNRSRNFAARDSLRILMDGAQLDHYDNAENILSPADNPTVVTVGTSDTGEVSDVSVRLQKPELQAKSALEINDGRIMEGTTISAAFVAAGFGILKSLDPTLDRQALLSYTAAPSSDVTFSAQPNASAQNGGLTLAQLGFSGRGAGGCFNFYSPNQVNVPGYLSAASSRGSVTSTTGGLKIMVDFDPIELVPGQKRQRANDAIVGTPNGFVIMSRAAAQNLPQADAEVFQQPVDAAICGQAPSGNYSNNPNIEQSGPIFNRSFWLPALN